MFQLMGFGYALIVIALAGNVILAGVSLFRGEPVFLEDLWFCYGAIAFAAVNAAGSIAAFLLLRAYAPVALAVLFVHGSAFIFIFAGIHSAYGLLRGENVQLVSKVTAIYFSMVTWTTLGYGDYAPHPDLSFWRQLKRCWDWRSLGY